MCHMDQVSLTKFEDCGKLQDMSVWCGQSGPAVPEMWRTGVVEVRYLAMALQV